MRLIIDYDLYTFDYKTIIENGIGNRTPMQWKLDAMIITVHGHWCPSDISVRLLM